MGNLGMVRGGLVISGLVMLRSLTMMLRRLLVMFRSLFVVFVNIVTAHDALPGLIGLRPSPGRMTRLRHFYFVTLTSGAAAA